MIDRAKGSNIESIYSIRAEEIMEQNQISKTTQQRRKLLKSALAASTVAGVGYSGSALASVAHCISNQNLNLNDVVLNNVNDQFRIGSTPPTGSPWAWKQVFVNKYKNGSTGSPEEGFSLSTPAGSGVYRVSDFTKFTTPILQSTGGYPKTAWVVVYFDAVTKAEKGAFPQFKDPNRPTAGIAQASLGCVNSLSPGLGNNYTYGG